MSSNAVKLSGNNEVDSRPQLTVISTPSISDEVYRRYNEHFIAMPRTSVSDAIIKIFPNNSRNDYRRHAETPLDHRLRIASDLAPLSSQRSLERLADFILAEDHSRGVLLRDRFRDSPDEHTLEYAPLGDGAKAYMKMDYRGQLTPELIKLRKTCTVCLSYFIDTSPATNAKRCSEQCTKRHERLRKRMSRNGGDDRRKRDRERQQLEYLFYSPYELRHMDKYTENITSDKGIDRKIQAKKRGGKKKPTTINMDSENAAYHFRPYRPRMNGESGELVVKHRRPEVVARYIRMKYGEIKPYTPDIYT